jgi:KUP system potassium uptake protein
MVPNQFWHISRDKVFTGKTLIYLAYQSIGVIYGDIGTSPLYVYSSTFTSEPSYDDLVGVLSIILWSLTMMVTVKYVLVILHADNEGEGGTFSTYSLLSRYVSATSTNEIYIPLIKMLGKHHEARSARSISHQDGEIPFRRSQPS